MKKVLFSLAILAASFGANAQSESSSNSGLKFSIGVDLGLPIGDFADINSFGIGGSVQGD